MTDQQQADPREAVEIDPADPIFGDPIFTAVARDPELVAADLHRPRRFPLWPLLTLLGIVAPLAGFVVSHWPAMSWSDMAAHADTVKSTAANVSSMNMTPDPSHTPFEAAMTKAMMNMDMAMNLPYSGDADRDFARMMIPHHQGAIDMAQLEMVYGKDARLRRLAQEIIVTQQQEIAVMQLALRQAAIADPQSPQTMPGPQAPQPAALQSTAP